MFKKLFALIMLIALVTFFATSSTVTAEENTFGITAFGFGAGSDGYIQNVVHTGVGTFLTKRAFILGKVTYNRTIDNNNKQEYGLGGTYGYILSEKFVVTCSFTGERAETDEDNVKQVTIGASGAIFPWGKLISELDKGEHVGLMLDLKYIPSQRDFWAGLLFSTYFGM